MYNLSKKEIDFISEKFGNVENFVSFYEDKLLFDLQMEKQIPINVDLTPYSSKGIVTGLLISIREEENKFKVDMLVNGSYRVFDIEDCWAENFVRVKNQLLENANDCNWSVENINNYKFAQNKPFLLIVENNVITKINPLDFNLYESCIDMWMKIVDE